MDAAKRKRAAARGWLTRAIKGLEAIIATPDVGKVDLEDGLQELSKRLEAVNQAQEEVEIQLTDVKDLEADMTEAGPYVDKAASVRRKATKMLQKILKEDDDGSSSASSGHSNYVQKSVRLPKLELPKFSGEVTKFSEFWDQFKATIDQTSLPVITKFTYLKNLLEGEAKAAIDGLTLTEDHYTVACKLLQERFGRKELIIFSHIQSLLSLESSGKDSDLSKLKSIQDQVLVHVRSLEALDIDGNTYGMFLTPLVLSRLPSGVRMEWAREGKGKEGDLEWLLEFLRKEIERRERADTFKVTKSSDDGKKEQKKFPKKSTGAALHTHDDSQPRCILCKKSNHTTEKCFGGNKMPFEEKKRAFIETKSCFKCALSGHLSKTCKKKCTQCGGSHHKWLCWGKSGEKCEKTPTKSDDSGDTANKNPTPSSATDQTNSSLSCIAQSVTQRVVLQTAKVTVQSPQYQ